MMYDIRQICILSFPYLTQSIQGHAFNPSKAYTETSTKRKYSLTQEKTLSMPPKDIEARRLYRIYTSKIPCPCPSPSPPHLHLHPHLYLHLNLHLHLHLQLRNRSRDPIAITSIPAPSRSPQPPTFSSPPQEPKSVSCRNALAISQPPCLQHHPSPSPTPTPLPSHPIPQRKSKLTRYPA